MHLLNQLPHPEKVVWLKNEYGDVNIDKLMIEKTNVQTQELLNGCLCCVLVGKLENALLEIMEKFQPERIIIETSGTAYPGPIVWEINRLQDRLRVDSVINIVDALNFSGYSDRSYAAKLQAKVNDLIIINKYPAQLDEETELEIEQRLNDIYEVSLQTPKIKSVTGKVDYKLLIGLDNGSLQQLTTEEIQSLKDEPNSGANHHEDEVETFYLEYPAARSFDITKLDNYLRDLKSYGFIRIKGVVYLTNNEGKSSATLYNWVYGQSSTQSLAGYGGKNQILFMGKGILRLKKQVMQELP